MTAAGSMCSSWWKDLAILAVVAGLWIGALLGVRPLSNPDEGRYGEIPREMAVTGDYVTPRLNGVKYFEKPPLVYWLSALTFEKFGVSEFTVRLWGAIFSIIGVLMTYAAGRALHGRAAGIWSAIVLATTIMYYIFSQIILLDMTVAVTISGALFAFILAMREPRGRKRFGLFMVLYVCMALAVLSKGLIGIALPGAVIFLWVLLLNRWRALWPFYPLVGTVVLLAIAAPWHIYAARANPDFLNFYFYHEHWLRFTTRIHGRYEPWWFFLPVLLVGLFPWVYFTGPAVREALAGGWKARRAHSENWFFLIWVVFIMAFFSKSQSKLIPYILPVFPAIAVLMGPSLSRIWSSGSASPIRRAAWGFIVSALLLLVAAVVAPNIPGQPDLNADLLMLRIVAGGALLLGAATAFVGLRRDQPRLIIGAVAISTAALLLTVNYGGGSFEKTSTKKLAMILKPMLKPGDRVYSVGYYPQDLPVYLNRLISVVGYRGELGYGIDAEPDITSSRFLTPQAFPEEWARPGDAYAVVRKKEYDKWVSSSGIPLAVLGQSDRFVLIAKFPTPPSP